MEMKKIKMYTTLIIEGASPKCIGTKEDGESIVDIREHLRSYILTLHILNVCYKVWIRL